MRCRTGVRRIGHGAAIPGQASQGDRAVRRREVAEALCDRIAILLSGKVIAMGTMDELRAQVDTGGAAHLEDIFLKVTGGDAVADVVASLRGELP
jgi:hypothetical protein